MFKQLYERASLLILFAALALAGCQPVQPAAQPAPAASEAAQSETAETRIITDARGEQVEVPVAPQRVVTLSEQDLDGALALGVKPVGSVNGRGSQHLPAYLGDRVEGITSVGSLGEPSLEAIAALDPDLILIGGIYDAIASLPEQLSQIAPTVVTYRLEDDWKTALAGTAAALNKEAEAQGWLAEYDAKVAEIQAALGENEGAEVSIVRWNPQGPVTMLYDAFSSLIIRDLGLARPQTQQGAGYAHTDTLSLEMVDRLDADWIFVGTLNPDGAAALEQAQQNVLFQNMGAAQAGHVTGIDGAIWTSRGGPLASLLVLDDVRAALAGE